MSALQAEFDYYLAHQLEFVEKHNGKVVLIKDQKLAGVYDSPLDAMAEAKKKEFAPGTFLVQRVSPDSSEYTSSFHSRVAFH